MRTLSRKFYQFPAVTVARELLGQMLIHETPEGRAAGIIVETEAYAGKTDAACHSARMDAPRPGHRTEVMFQPGGCAYVYLIYGMYCCFNVVTAPAGCAEAVLIRALEPLEGIELMRQRRGVTELKKLCSGPGKLCQALGITRAENGMTLLSGPLRIQKVPKTPEAPKPKGISPAGQSEYPIAATPRINVDYAGEDALLPYRFLYRDSPYLSTRRFLT